MGRSIKRKQPDLRVTVEISRTKLSMIIVEGGAAARRARGHHFDWLQEDGSLNTDHGVRDLTAALSSLVAKEKLSGAQVHVALSSDFCVTRVLAGETERIRTELRSLRDRADHYLLLGAGRKAVASSSRTIDAKHVQGWMTVTNKRTLDNVVRAVEEAGLQVELIEHGMVAMCRAVGQMGRDTFSPVIIVEVNQRGVDLGISYRGQLLFNYRPGGIDSKGQIAKIVARHLERIQRYCNRHFRFAEGKIREIFVCGFAEDVELVREQLSHASGLSAEILDPKKICPEWDYHNSAASDLGFLSAIGSALVDDEQLDGEADQRGLPNLMDYYRSGQRAALLPALAKSGWPIAATVLLSLAVYSGAWIKGRTTTAVEAQQRQLNEKLGEIRAMRVASEAASAKAESLAQIKQRCQNPPWYDLIAMIAQSMPQDVWLNKMQIEQDGEVALTGPSRSEDSVYEFLKSLKKVPVLSHVNLESQRQGSTRTGANILFDIKCHYVTEQKFSERVARND